MGMMVNRDKNKEVENLGIERLERFLVEKKKFFFVLFDFGLDKKH